MMGTTYGRPRPPRRLDVIDEQAIESLLAWSKALACELGELRNACCILLDREREIGSVSWSDNPFQLTWEELKSGRRKVVAKRKAKPKAKARRASR
jgi:hypothetical protein